MRPPRHMQKRTLVRSISKPHVKVTQFEITGAVPRSSFELSLRSSDSCSALEYVEKPYVKPVMSAPSRAATRMCHSLSVLRVPIGLIIPSCRRVRF
jgi:hypothetical protein